VQPLALQFLSLGRIVYFIHGALGLIALRCVYQA
jgi:hypothetical protein